MPDLPDTCCARPPCRFAMPWLGLNCRTSPCGCWSALNCAQTCISSAGLQLLQNSKHSTLALNLPRTHTKHPQRSRSHDRQRTSAQSGDSAPDIRAPAKQPQGAAAGRTRAPRTTRRRCSPATKTRTGQQAPACRPHVWLLAALVCHWRSRRTGRRRRRRRRTPRSARAVLGRQTWRRAATALAECWHLAVRPAPGSSSESAGQ